MKKFKAVVNDPKIPAWEVICKFWNPPTVWAIFRGPKCREYARAHAKMLNSLPEKDKP